MNKQDIILTQPWWLSGFVRKIDLSKMDDDELAFLIQKIPNLFFLFSFLYENPSKSIFQPAFEVPNITTFWIEATVEIMS